MNSRISRVFAAALLCGAVAACDNVVQPEGTLPAEEAGTGIRFAIAQDEYAVMFGPRRFDRQRGAPTAEIARVAPEDFASFEGPSFLYVENGDPDGGGRVSAAWISIDGVPVFGPQDFSQRVQWLKAEIALSPNSAITVKNAGAPGSFLTIRVEGKRVAGRANIGAEGGQVRLEGVAEFEFPQGFFTETRRVEVTRVEDAIAMAQFTEFEGLFRVGTKTPYQVRVLAGEGAIADGNFRAVLTLPEDFLIPDGHRPELFIQVHEDLVRLQNGCSAG